LIVKVGLLQKDQQLKPGFHSNTSNARNACKPLRTKNYAVITKSKQEMEENYASKNKSMQSKSRK